MEKDPIRPRYKDRDTRTRGSISRCHWNTSYLENCTSLDTAFAVNLLAIHSVVPTKRHWTRDKRILRYVNGRKDLGLFFQRN